MSFHRAVDLLTVRCFFYERGFSMVYPLATWDELRNADPGQDLGTWPKNIARAGKDCLCDVYRNYPEWASSVADPIYNVMNIPSLEDLCRNNPRTNFGDIPVQPNGGQCPVYYVARTRFYGMEFGPSGPRPFDTGWSGYGNAGVLGPVSVFTREASGNGQVSRDIWAVGADGQQVRIGSCGGKKTITAGLHEFRRQDGLPDTCGKGPVPPVRVPPVGDIHKPTPVPTINGPVIVPVVVPVGVFIHPTFQINIGSVNLNFSLGGVYLTPQDDKRNPTPRPVEPQPVPPVAPPLPPTRPPISNPDPAPNPPAPSVDLTGIESELEKIKSYTRRPKTTLVEEFVQTGPSGQELLPEKSVLVKINVIQAPPNIRTQSGGAFGPEVRYQGWMSFGKGGYFGERIPLSYENNIYPVPVECDSVSWTVYDGGNAQVYAILRTDLLECETYECG